MDNFETKNKTIEDPQEYIMKNTEGVYVLLAGPGTGKTTTILERMKNIPKDSRVLCLTFTSAAVQELNDRMPEEAKKKNLEITVSTYHGFCTGLIDEYKDELELPANYKVMSDSISYSLIKECIKELINDKKRKTKFKGWTASTGNLFSNLKTIKEGIDAIKMNQVTKEEFFNNFHNDSEWEASLKQDLEEAKNKLNNLKRETFDKETDYIKKRTELEAEVEKKERNLLQMPELWEIKELYDKKMIKASYIDYNDMINIIINKFDTDKKFLDTIANRYDYLMVDEYQDTNPFQNMLVLKIGHVMAKQNVLVVGDDDQMVYRFQGASLDTMANFIKDFDVKKENVRCIRKNRRSTKNILDFSRKVVVQDLAYRLEGHPDFEKYDINKELYAVNPELIGVDEKVTLTKYQDVETETMEIVEQIQQLIDKLPKKDGVPQYKEIAILTRKNDDLIRFSELLSAYGIPCELKKGKSIFEIPAVNVFIMYLQVLINPDMYSGRIVQYLMSKPFSIKPKDCVQILKNKPKYNNAIDAAKDLLKKHKEEPDNKEYWLEDEKRIKKFLENYDYLSELKYQVSIKETLLHIGARTGIFKEYAYSKNNLAENILGLKRLIDEAELFESTHKGGLFHEFVEYITNAQESGEKITIEKDLLDSNAVQLSSYHGSKGRQFTYVFMPNFNKKNNTYAKEGRPKFPIEPMPDDTTCYNIAFADYVKLAYVAMTRARLKLMISYTKPNPSVLITDSMKEMTEPLTANNVSGLDVAKYSLKEPEIDYENEYQQLIDYKLANFNYSPSSINRYISCPRKFLYEYILGFSDGSGGNADWANYGTALHNTFQEVMEIKKDKSKFPTKAEALALFEKHYKNLVFVDEPTFLNKGQETINKYYPYFIEKYKTANFIEAEKEINSSIKGYPFVGKLDRLDKDKDGYIIFDYKSNQNRGRKIAEGGENEGYYYQIGLYKYIFAKENNIDLDKIKTIFLYPDDSKQKYEQELVLEKEACEAIVKKFEESIDDIKAHKFPAVKDKPHACKYCSGAAFCKTKYGLIYKNKTVEGNK